MKKILITRKLITPSEEYASKIFNPKLNREDVLLTKEELIEKSSDCDGILSSLTEKIDLDVISKHLGTNIKIRMLLQSTLEITQDVTTIMFDLTYGIYFLLLSTTLIISILVVVLSLSNRVKKVEEEPNEAEKSIQKLNNKGQ